MYRIDQAGTIHQVKPSISTRSLPFFNQEPALFQWTACPFSTRSLPFFSGQPALFDWTDRLPRNRELAGYGTIFT